MLDDDKLEGAVRDLIMDICEVMYRRGYDAVPIGAMMRMVGVGKEQADKHDDEMLLLDEDFERMLAEKKKKKPPAPTKAPSGVTLH